MNNRIQPLEVLQAKPRVAGCRIGSIVRLSRRPVVDFMGNPLGPQPARVVASLSTETLAMACDSRLPVLLAFEDDDPARPIIVDVVIEELSKVPEPNAVFEAANEGSLTHAVPSSLQAATAYLATIVGIEDGSVWLQSDRDGPCTVRASTTVALRNLKDPVIAVNLENDTTVIIGQVSSTVTLDGAGSGGAEVSLRGERIRIEADVELTLKVGSCEIRLDGRGKVVTTADTIVSRARGENKIQGGSVRLN